MDIKALIQVAGFLATIAVSTHQLPRILQTIRLAQLHLIKESQSSSWGKAMPLRSESHPSLGNSRLIDRKRKELLF